MVNYFVLFAEEKVSDRVLTISLFATIIKIKRHHTRLF